MKPRTLIFLFIEMALLGALVATISFGAAVGTIRTVREGPSFTFVDSMAEATGSPWGEALAIFLNNFIVAGFMAIGIVWIGRSWVAEIPIILSASLNGFILGLVLMAVAMVAGPALVIAGILPHGMLEIPAIMLSWMMGLEGVNSIRGFSELIGPSPGGVYAADLYRNTVVKRNVAYFLKYCLPLLAVAAIIETFITPVVMGLV